MVRAGVVAARSISSAIWTRIATERERHDHACAARRPAQDGATRAAQRVRKRACVCRARRSTGRGSSLLRRRHSGHEVTTAHRLHKDARWDRLPGLHMIPGRAELSSRPYARAWVSWPSPVVAGSARGDRTPATVCPAVGQCSPAEGQRVVGHAPSRGGLFIPRSAHLRDPRHTWSPGVGLPSPARRLPRPSGVSVTYARSCSVKSSA